MTDLPKRIIAWDHGHWESYADCMVIDGAIIYRRDDAPGALGAAAMRAMAAGIAADESAGKFAGPDSRRTAAYIQRSIFAIPLPAPADLLAAARELPEIAALIAAATELQRALAEFDVDALAPALEGLGAALRAIGGPT